MEKKSIFVSKTFWVNVIAATLGCLAVFTPELLAGLGLGENAQEKALAAIGGITTILNIILRFISNTPVSFKGGAVILLLVFGLSSCSINKQLENTMNYFQKHGEASYKRELNGAITTTVKYKNFYNPDKVKKTFTKFIATYDAVEPSIQITATTTDTTLKIQIPAFKK